jgi:D-alanine-D-alanine ligase
MKKTRVGILFGGRSAEHEVSLKSARNILRAIDRETYDVLLIAIDKGGGWGIVPEDDFSRLFERSEAGVEKAPPSIDAIGSFGSTTTEPNGSPRKSSTPEGRTPRGRTPEGQTPEDVAILLGRNDRRILSADPLPVDVVFPVLHGTYGEDGTVQGLLKLAGVPFVGSGVLGSAVCMDKDVMKRLLRDAGIPTPRFLAFDWSARGAIVFEGVTGTLGTTLFIKPANLGSSVGISKAASKRDFDRAVALAFQYDVKIVIEEFIAGRELECSVLGNESPVASVPGEVKPSHEFYSYDAKYIDANGALLEIPAVITEAQKKEIQELAVRSYKVLCCEGMARADFFLADDGRILVNELNTLPGFTNISMYPKLWEESGLSQTDLVHRLIELALERHERERKVQTRYPG